MVKTLIYQNVEDFGKWQQTFDGLYSFRKSSGELSCSVTSLYHNPNAIYVVNEWDSIDAFKVFISSYDLSNAMKYAGILAQLHSFILSTIENDNN